MNPVVRLLIGVVTTFVLMIGSGSAEAQVHTRLLVLVDATGSMTQPCVGEPPACTGQTRFALAQDLAEDYIDAKKNQTVFPDTLSVAVYTFAGVVGLQARTLGFVDPDTAAGVIPGLAVTPFNTPLADAMCTSVDNLIAGSTAGVNKFVFFTDGGENSSLGPCSGPYTPPQVPPPYLGGSWHNNVYTKLTTASLPVAVDTYFFTTVAFAGVKATTAVQEQAASPARAASCIPGQPCIQVTDSEFFAAISRDTGGRFVQIRDDQPLPVFGDVDSDHCVSRADALLVARQFGRAPTPELDVDNDGVIGFGDYSFVASRIGQGCLVPPADRYVASGPLVCPANGGTLTIDGKAVTGSSFAVTGGHNCRIVIKNSLIVGDLAGISMAGNNRVTVDNSIVVGNGVIGVSGFTKLSAAKTIFHGAKLEPDGALEYVDRGGNVWEE
jgi:hypothetical protein